jgi:hypothetical protein
VEISSLKDRKHEKNQEVDELNFYTKRHLGHHRHFEESVQTLQKQHSARNLINSPTKSFHGPTIGCQAGAYLCIGHFWPPMLNENQAGRGL